MNHTKNYLLNKQVVIFQPVDGYRASTDAVFLSSLVNKVKKNDTILDAGSGTGAVSLCLAERFKDIKPQITGLEIQEELVELSNMSAHANNFDFLNYIHHDIKNKFSGSFNHIITNPPYSESDMPSPNQSKAIAHNHQDFSLKSWIEFCLKRLAPQGYFYMINRTEALDEILHHTFGKLGEIKVIPLYSKPEQKAKRVMIIGRKDSHTALSILEGIITHNSDGTYTKKAEKILRSGKCFFD